MKKPQIESKDEKNENDKKLEFRKINRFNTSLYSCIESLGERTLKEKEDLNKLGDFLKNRIIPLFMKNVLANSMMVPLDMEGLVDQMHLNGINLRYFGKLHEMSISMKNIQISRLIERTVFVRALIKIFRQIAIKENRETLMKIVIQYLNMILGTDRVRQLIEEKIRKIKENLNKNEKNKPQQNRSQKKRKKNKKRNRKKIQSLLVENHNEHLMINPIDLLEKLKSIIFERYSFKVEQIKNLSDLSFLSTETDKLTFLREFSKNFGIQFIPKKYNFGVNESMMEYPLKLNDVTGFFFKTKFADLSFEGLKYNFKIAEQELAGKNYETVKHILKGCQ